MANADPLLNFEGFLKKKNSFGLHFVGPVGRHIFGDVYRDQPWYRKCAAKHPEFEELAAELRQMEDRQTPEYFKKLYVAYVLMHPYAPTDWSMFA